MSRNIRDVALDLLINIEKKQSYSNLALNQVIKEKKISSIDIGLLTEIIYGTLQHKLTLSFYLEPFVVGKKMEQWVRLLLELSVFQLVYLDRVPDHAVLHEAVEIAKKRGHLGTSKFVNGVLRNLLRQGIPALEKITNSTSRLAIETSHPEWLVAQWIADYDFLTAQTICQTNQIPPIQTARVNLAKANRSEVIAMLESEGFNVEANLLLAEAIVNKQRNLAETKAFTEGYLSIQDISSMLVAYAVDPQPTDMILDACAAPGGKTTHLAEKMNNQGTIIALDIHRHKVKLIIQQAKRLGLSNIKSIQLDARKITEKYPVEYFDKILVDAPCSGLGVLRRKPEARYNKSVEDIKKLAQIQMTILEKAAQVLKKGGYLVYSTCTISKAENEMIVEKFLSKNPDFIPDLSLRNLLPEALRLYVQENYIQILPQYFDLDGFFIARFQKRG